MARTGKTNATLSFSTVGRVFEIRWLYGFLKPFGFGFKTAGLTLGTLVCQIIGCRDSRKLNYTSKI